MTVDELRGSPRIDVEDLGEPEPLPDEHFADVEADELADELEEPIDRAKVAQRLVPFVQLPFRVAALRLGDHWQVSRAEAEPIAIDVAEGLPERWLHVTETVAHPWISAAVQVGELVRARAQRTRELMEAQHAGLPAGAAGDRPAAGAGAPAAPGMRPAPRASGPSVPRDDGADGASDSGEGDSVAGLGLRVSVLEGAARRRDRRSALDAARGGE